MTVTDLILNFRSGLLALVPIAERVCIPWNRTDAYDDWDSITNVLFENLVIRVLQWSLPNEEGHQLNIPPYDLLLESYEGMSTIEVVYQSKQSRRFVFHAFGTLEHPFDAVEVRPMAENGQPLANDLEIYAIADVSFVFCANKGEKFTYIKELEMANS